MAKSQEEMSCYLARNHAITRAHVIWLMETGIAYEVLDRVLNLTVDKGLNVQATRALIDLMMAQGRDEGLREIQHQIGRWSVEQFGDNLNNKSKMDGYPMGSKAALWGLVEEVGELNHVTICGHQGRRGYDNEVKYREDRDDALGDILVFLCDYACRESVDLMSILSETWHKVVKYRKNTGKPEDWDEITHTSDPRLAPEVMEVSTPLRDDDPVHNDDPDEKVWNRLDDVVGCKPRTSSMSTCPECKTPVSDEATKCPECLHYFGERDAKSTK